MTDHRRRPTTEACRRPNTNPDWWAADAPTHHQTIAATLCMTCPAITACNQLRLTLGTEAAGTYATHYLPLTDTETDTEFDAIITAMGWNAHIPNPPPNLGDTDRWEQLALWGPNVDARMLHTSPRRRRVGPSRGVPGSAGTPDGLVPQGA